MLYRNPGLCRYFGVIVFLLLLVAAIRHNYQHGSRTEHVLHLERSDNERAMVMERSDNEKDMVMEKSENEITQAMERPDNDRAVATEISDNVRTMERSGNERAMERADNERSMAMERADNESFYYRRRPTKVCPFRFDVVTSPREECDDDIFMVILTHSYHKYKDRRQAIRRTWGGAANGKLEWPGKQISKKVKMIFVFGENTNATMNDLVKKEGELFDDILMGNFTEAYVNMTYKSLFGFKYVSEHCSSAKYLLKTDDDMIVNIPDLVEALDKDPLTHSILGIQMKGKVRRSGKWAVSREIFPFDNYPVYEAGGAYVITNDIVRELFETAEYVPQFSVDDAYITGILAKIIGANHAKRPYVKGWGPRTISACEVVKNTRVWQTNMTPSKLTDLWEQLKHAKCD